MKTSQWKHLYSPFYTYGVHTKKEFRPELAEIQLLQQLRSNFNTNYSSGYATQTTFTWNNTGIQWPIQLITEVNDFTAALLPFFWLGSITLFIRDHLNLEDVLKSLHIPEVLNKKKSIYKCTSCKIGISLPGNAVMKSRCNMGFK